MTSDNSIGFGNALIETFQDEIKEKDAEIERLRAENERLRAENGRLRLAALRNRALEGR